MVSACLHHQYVRVVVTVHSCQYLVSLVFYIEVIPVDVKLKSLWFSLASSWWLMMSVKHIFMCLLEICLSSFEKWLLKSLLILIVLFVFLLLILGVLHILSYKIRCVYTRQIFSPNVWLFIFLMVSLLSRNIFYFDKIQYSNCSL